MPSASRDAASNLTLVTGGAGYIGSVIVDELLLRGHRVRVLDSLIHGSVPSLLHVWNDRQFEFVQGDIRDRAATRGALEDVSAVVHLAAIVGDPACARQPSLAQEVNFEASRMLLDDAEAMGIGRFVFASTCSNYGRRDNEALATEEGELAPVSLYAETKVAAELDLLARSNGVLANCCLRLATVYGASARMRFDLTVNEFTRDVCLGTDLVVFGEQFWRPYTHVRDAALAVVLALESPVEDVAGQVFNVGATEENYRKRDIVELLKQRVPSAKIEFVQRDEDPRDYRVSFEKIKAQLGFRAERSVADGIDEVMALLRSGIIGDPYAAVYRN
jgi:nucleoside-diphosphate-sugar epimerase